MKDASSFIIALFTFSIHVGMDERYMFEFSVSTNMKKNDIIKEVAVRKAPAHYV